MAKSPLATSARDMCRMRCESWGHTINPPAASLSLKPSTSFTPEPQKQRFECSRKLRLHTATPVGAFRLPGRREAAVGPPTSIAIELETSACVLPFLDPAKNNHRSCSLKTKARRNANPPTQNSDRPVFQF